MDYTLRRDPRRPYVITSGGIRRVVLGATAVGAAALRATAVGATALGAAAVGATAGGAAPVGATAAGTTGPAASASHYGGAPHGGGAHASVAAKPLRTSEQPRDFILAIAFSERGVLDEHPRQAVAAAALLAGPHTAVVAAVLGELHEDLAACGADIVVVLSDCDLRQFRPDHALSRLSETLKQYPPAHVLIPDRLNGEGDLGRRLAAAFGASVATHVVEISPDHVAAYQLVMDDAGLPSRRLARRPLPDVILLEPNVVDSRLPFVGAGHRIDDTAVPANPAAASATEHARASNTSASSEASASSDISDAAPVHSAAVEASVRTNAHRAPQASTPSAYLDGGLRALEASDLPLEEADLIASAGNGVIDVGLFLRLTKAMGAATGASRVAVDDGRFARDKQIGATGKTVSANAYIAIGISGAVQHLQGIKDCRHVIAINRDIAAPMIQRADLSIIGDAQGVMQALLEAVEAARTSGRTAEANGSVTRNATQERAA